MERAAACTVACSGSVDFSSWMLVCASLLAKKFYRFGPRVLGLVKEGETIICLVCTSYCDADCTGSTTLTDEQRKTDAWKHHPGQLHDTHTPAEAQKVISRHVRLFLARLKTVTRPYCCQSVLRARQVGNRCPDLSPCARGMTVWHRPRRCRRRCSLGISQQPRYAFETLLDLGEWTGSPLDTARQRCGVTPLPAASNREVEIEDSSTCSGNFRGLLHSPTRRDCTVQAHRRALRTHDCRQTLTGSLPAALALCRVLSSALNLV